MKSKKLKLMDRIKIRLEKLSNNPEKVIFSTKILILIGCIFITISAIESISSRLIGGILNLILVAVILIRNFTMKSLPNKLGIYGLEFLILGITSFLFGDFLGAIIIFFIGIVLIMIFQEDTIIKNEENEENFFNILKSYVITNRISVIAVIFTFSGVIPLFNSVSYAIVMLPFEVIGLFLAKYERRYNPNALSSWAMFFVFIFCCTFIIHFLIFVGTPDRI